MPSPDGDRLLSGGAVVYAVAEGDTGYDPIHVVYDAIKEFQRERARAA